MLFCLSLNYNTANSFLYENGIQIYHFKAKDSEIKPYALCLGNIRKYLTVDEMEKNLVLRDTWTISLSARILLMLMILKKKTGLKKIQYFINTWIHKAKKCR